MNCAFVSACSSVIAANCVVGNVLTLVALQFGAKEVFLGFLSFATIAPLVCTAFTMSAVERVGKRKILLLWYSVSVIFLTPLLFLPVLAERWPAKACLGLILAATLLRTTATAMGSTGWFPLLHDVVPTDITGRFFARMRTYWQSAGLITVIFAACLMGDEPAWWKFELLFAVALIAYIVRVLALVPTVEKPPQINGKKQPNIFSRFSEVLNNRLLRLLIIYIIFYMVAAGMAVPFMIKLLKDLGYSEGFILAAGSMVGLGAIISLRSWGKLADRFGNRAIFSISHIGMIVLTLMWVMVDEKVFGGVLVFILFLLSSVFNSGNGIAQTRYILHAVPGSKQNYINIINIIAHSALAVSPLLGGLFLWATEDYRFQSGGVNLNNYHLLFVISALLFVIPHILRRKLKLGKDTPTSQVLTFAMRPIRSIFGPFVRFGRKTPGSGPFKT